MKFFLSGLVLFALGILGSGCATRATPPGGPKDEEPPKVVFEKSTPNFQTDYLPEEIVVTLDEWVKLNDPFNQILVSPPLQKRPDVRIKGRSVVVKFDEEEVLRENATYTINFGEAIQDITESNPIKNYSYVFSTGPVIDSLIVTGRVMDAISGEPIENATIMMYTSFTDSIIVKEKPFYATKSLKDGSFTIENVKEDTFKIVAVVDENLNYLYDPAVELLGAMDSLVIITDTLTAEIEIAMSMENPELYRERIDSSNYNNVILSYTRKPSEIQFEKGSQIPTIYLDFQEKQVSVWHKAAEKIDWFLFATDTVQIRTDTIPIHTYMDTMGVDLLKEQTRLKNTAHPEDPFYICFDRPVEFFDTARIILEEGIGKRKIPVSLSVHDSLPFCISLQNLWKADTSYQITLLPGSVIDFFSITHDTIVKRIPIANTERFGTIILTIDSLETTQNYILELMLKNKTERNLYISNTNKYQQQIKKLRPGTYQVRITEDRNKNKQWDPIQYFEHQPAERIANFSLEELRSNWDVDATFTWNK